MLLLNLLLQVGSARSPLVVCPANVRWTLSFLRSERHVKLDGHMAETKGGGRYKTLPVRTVAGHSRDLILIYTADPFLVVRVEPSFRFVFKSLLALSACD